MSTAFRVFRHGSGLCQRLAVADLLNSEGDGWVWNSFGGRVEIIYSDPPGNPGNQQWWRRDAGVEPPESYDRLLDAWCWCVATLRPEHVLCEQSVNPKHRGLFMAAVARCVGWRLPLLEEWTVYYGSPGSRSCVRPNTLLHFGRVPLTTDPSGLRGEEMTRRVFQGLGIPKSPEYLGAFIVADPCMGKGMTSRMAHEFGCHCYGTELNPKRLDYAIRWLLRQGYVEDQR